MGILITILIGLVIGVVAKFLMPGPNPSGVVLTVLLGIAGAVIATYLGQLVGWYSYGQPAGFIASVLGAMLLLFVFHITGGRRRMT